MLKKHSDVHAHLETTYVLIILPLSLNIYK